MISLSQNRGQVKRCKGGDGVPVCIGFNPKGYFLLLVYRDMDEYENNKPANKNQKIIVDGKENGLGEFVIVGLFD